MKLYPIPKQQYYFIHPTGFVIGIKNGHEFRLPVYFKGNRKPFVKLGAKEYELAMLMIESFGLMYSPTDKLTYKVLPDGSVPLNTIKFTKIVSHKSQELQSKDYNRILLYKCSEKCSSANNRCQKQLSVFEVLESLKLTKFTCFYCGDTLCNTNWHLDHFIPISKGGENSFKNIVPSCPTCNKMKSDIDPFKFIQKCKKIFDYSTSKHNHQCEQ